MHSTPRLPDVMDIEYNKGDIDWYVRRPTDPPLVELKARKLPRKCEEGAVTLG